MTFRTIAEALRTGRQRVGATEARILLRHASGRDDVFLAAHPETELRDAEAALYRQLIERRAAGEPVAYLTGEREFYGRAFRVTPAVLIPRPETELLVDLALERIPRSGRTRVLDLGTGTGCIAIAIASERSRSDILAVDQSPAALSLARRNAVELRTGNVSFLQSDWFSALREDDRFDVIVANPPYVAEEDAHLCSGDLRFEPRVALVAGADGLQAIRAVLAGAARHLARNGWLLLEHGDTQGATVCEMLRVAAYEDVFSARDLAGVDRASGGRWSMD